MDQQQNTGELDKWFSTYGVITAERILGTYDLRIPQTELLPAIKSPFSFYHQLVQVPLKNVLSGIILQQAHDYHVYAQKLFIDYLLSGETAKSEDAQGGGTRESLENERKQLVTLGEEFREVQIGHDTLISTSQARLIKLVKEWKVVFEASLTNAHNNIKSVNSEVKKNKLKQAMEHALINCDLKSSSADRNLHFVKMLNEFLQIELNDDKKNLLSTNFTDFLEFTLEFEHKIDPFNERANELQQQALSFRTQFYETIIRIYELMTSLPEYKIDPTQDAINREFLYFDKSIGELV